MRKTKSIALILGVLAMSLSLGYLVLAAWTEPSSPPPGDNVPAPLNTSINAQSKEGALIIGTNSALTTGLIVRYGNVGIGTINPSQKLEINGGTVYIKVKATADTGLILDGGSTLNSSVFYYKSGNLKAKTYVPSNNSFRILVNAVDRITINTNGDVGIGTTNPGAKLEIAGRVKITGGSPGTNKVLTSDAAGLASWQTLASAGGGDITAVNAGSGLTGGGTSGDVTLNVGAGTGINVAADAVGLAYPSKSCGSGYAIRSFNVGSSAAPTCVAIGNGDITAVNAGTGLSGGGTSGNVTLSANTSYLQRRVSGTCPAGSSIRVINSDGSVSCETDDTGGGGSGDITAVCAGPGLKGGGTSGSVTLSLLQSDYCIWSGTMETGCGFSYVRCPDGYYVAGIQDYAVHNCNCLGGSWECNWSKFMCCKLW